MAHMTILRTYADRVDPNKLPPTVKLCHTDFSVTIFDKFPKSHFHFLLLPFIRPPLRAADLCDLAALLRLPREQAKAVLQNMRRDALAAKALVEAEMVQRFGFKWGIQMGFHAVPSLEYVPVPLRHLKCVHFLSLTLCLAFMCPPCVSSRPSPRVDSGGEPLLVRGECG